MAGRAHLCVVSTTAQPLRASSRIACHRSRLEQGSIPELGSSCRKDGAGVRGAHRGDALREQRGRRAARALRLAASSASANPQNRRPCRDSGRRETLRLFGNSE